MNKNAIIKALKRAAERKLDISSTADLIIDYLDLLCDTAPFQDQEVSQAVDTGALTELLARKDITKKTPSPPITKPLELATELGEERTPWETEDMLKALSDVSWTFTANPPGTTLSLNYRGTAVPDPKNMKGVMVYFKCPDVKTPAEIPVFFPCSEAELDPQAKIKEAKDVVEMLFKARNTPVVANTPRPTGPPAFGFSEGFL
jgi:hypothetical protein